MSSSNGIPYNSTHQQDFIPPRSVAIDSRNDNAYASNYSSISRSEEMHRNLVNQEYIRRQNANYDYPQMNHYQHNQGNYQQYSGNVNQFSNPVNNLPSQSINNNLVSSDLRYLLNALSKCS